MKILLHKIIAAWAPPIVVKGLRKARYIFFNLKGGKINDYQNQELINVIISKHQAFSEVIKKNTEINMDNFRTVYGLLLACQNEFINVVDFGGGPGTHHTIIKRIFPQKKFIWNIVETTGFVSETQKIHNDEVKYHTTLESIPQTPDIMFTSGALQYTNDPLQTLSKLVDQKAKYLVITRTPFTQGQKITEIQKSLLSENGPGNFLVKKDRIVEYKIIIENMSKIEEVISKNYVIKLKILEETKVHKFGKTEIDYFGYYCELKI